MVDEKFPHRELRDPRALRAMAHPVRVRLMEELLIDSPATATALAERVGESPANCSWHLRQLAKYGFVEEAEGGTGRQRPWRIVPEGQTWGSNDDDPELTLAGDAAGEVLFERQFALFRQWYAARRGAPAHWREASFSSHALLWLTPDELAGFTRAVGDLLEPYLQRVADPGRRPDDARPVHLVSWGIPARPVWNEG